MLKSQVFLASIFVTSSLLLTGCSYIETSSTDLKSYESAHGESDRQFQIKMLFGDFKALSTETLNTNAYPLKLAVAALVMKANRTENLPISMETYQKIMQRYGFYKPDRIANLEPGVAQPQFSYPAGVIRGILDIPMGVHAKVEIANITCSSCHGGVVYNSQGEPTKSLWLGSPNTSLNLQGYIKEVYAALKAVRFHQKELMQIVRKLYPDISSEEYYTLDLYVVPTSNSQMNQYERHGDDLAGFYIGAPGSANAVGAFKKMFDIIPKFKTSAADVGFVDVPDMAYRGLKSNITTDGTYTIPGEKAFSPISKEQITQDHFESMGIVAASFPVSAQGVQSPRLESLIPELKKTVGNFFSHYRPPVFPGNIDAELAAKGEKIYATSCSKCHGQYEAYTSGRKQLELISFPNKLIPLSKIGTDPSRINLVTDALKVSLSSTWLSKYVEVGTRDGYMPPVLSALWSTAPYLHNGSVPTLWQFLNPELRPQKFYTGGHKLDFKDLGISGYLAEDGVYRYLPGYEAWSTPVLIDTSLPGFSNLGHEGPLKDLSQDDKKNLIEYLKLL